MGPRETIGPSQPVDKNGWVLFLPEDSRLAEDFDRALAKAGEARPDAAAFECRCLPREAEHPLNLATMETPFLCGAFAIRREVLERLGGPSPRLPFYWAGIELSRRLRGAGEKLYYLPEAVVWRKPPAAEDEERAYLDDAQSRLLLAYQYGGVWAANLRYLKTLKNPRPFPGVRRALARAYAGHFLRLWPFLLRRFGHRAQFSARPPLFWEDVDFRRGEAPLPERLVSAPLVSVVVRTHKRREALREALASIARQSYGSFEVLVVEDGAPDAREMVEAEFAGLPLRYHATGEPIGRSRAGNLGLAMARGDYLCFLDDDDYFYPEHLETLMSRALAHPEADLVLGTAHVELVDEGPPRRLVRREMMHFDRLDVFTMSQMCQIPIQSVLFKRGLYEKLGGLDEKLSAHEDWSMWLRYLAKATRINPQGVDVHRATSVFVQSAAQGDAQRRMAAYMENDAALFGDESIRFDVSLADMRAFYNGMLSDLRHVQKLGKLDDFLTRQENREQRRD